MTLQGNTLASPECGTVYEPSNPVFEQINGGVGWGREEGEGRALLSVPEAKRFNT